MGILQVINSKPITYLRAVEMWHQVMNPSFDIMEQTLLYIRLENNIIAIRRARYHEMRRACKTFLVSDRKYQFSMEEEIILTKEKYLSNYDKG